MCLIQVVLARLVLIGHRFSIRSGDPVNPDHPFEPLPSTTRLQLFLRWMARTRNGAIEARLTVRTIEKYWRELRLMIRRATGHRYDHTDVLETEKVGVCSNPKTSANVIS